MDVEAATPNGTQEESRRKSGRTVKRPDIFAEEEHEGSLLINGSAKRKRAPGRPDPVNGEGDEEDEDDDDDGSEGEPDEEEQREQRRRQKKPRLTAKQAKPTTSTLAIRSANIPGKSSKAAKAQKARARPSQVNKEGLYAEVFGRGQTGEDAANIWIDSLNKDSVVAIRDLVNFVFECVGCELTISSPDIEDIDNVPNKLGDILEEYAKDKNAEYPLISKARQYADFQTVLVDFFAAVMKGLHNTGILYDQPEVYDNVYTWIVTMSGANYRPFRHTATTISLAMTTTLAELASAVQDSLAITATQLTTEKKKKTANKSRISSIQNSSKEDEKKLEAIEGFLVDAFNTVFAHRYRDVDERIRVACVEALGTMIKTYKKLFLDGQYLRYIGWVMSDPSSATRLEVVKQLKNLYKGQKNIAALRAFTDRFRQRMVEMGTSDADTAVRVEAIELLDRLRNAMLLEPTDIELIGRLIFDADPRVRKAVAKFFVANVQDVYTSEVDDFGDEFETALPDVADDFMSPQTAWLKFKYLAQTLGSVDKDSDSEKGEDIRAAVRPDDTDTRYMLATHAIFDHLAELSEWEILAGYLLYDHSTITAPAEDPTDVPSGIQAAYKLAPGEETILLDVLYFSTRMYLQSVLDSGKEKKGRSNATKDDIRKKQETAAHNLSTIIPQLLSRYGSTPAGAAAILRLEQLLDADLINELAGDGTYEALLDDVNKQFVTHSDRKVLAEASKALRTARSYEQSREATDSKVKSIWEDAQDTLFGLLKGKNVPTRGTLDRGVLAEVLNTCVRFSSLVTVSDCTEILEAKIGGKKGKGKATTQHETLLALLMDLVRRGIPDEDTVIDIAEQEDQVAIAATTTIAFYFRWKTVGLRKAIENNDTHGMNSAILTRLALQRANFIEALTPLITSGPPLDPVRVAATLNILDLYTLFATTKHMRSSKGEVDDDIQTNIATLTVKIPEDIMKEIMLTHEKMEKSFARKTHRKIVLPDEPKKKAKETSKKKRQGEETQEEIEALPEDSDDDGAANGKDSDDEEGESSSDDGACETSGGGKERKKELVLLAEQGLCEITSKLVLATIGGIIEGGAAVKARLQVNRTKLGKSYAAVVAYLDVKKEKGKGRSRAKVVGKGKEVKSKERVEAEPEPMELEDDPVEDDEVVEMEEREEREDVMRRELGDEGVYGDGDEVDEANGEDVPEEADDEILGD